MSDMKVEKRDLEEEMAMLYHLNKPGRMYGGLAIRPTAAPEFLRGYAMLIEAQCAAAAERNKRA
jgi:hypothetical protein